MAGLDEPPLPGRVPDAGGSSRVVAGQDIDARANPARHDLEKPL